MYGEGDAEISHERGAVVQENVLRLDVAMHHALAMRVIERTCDFAGDAYRVGDGQLPFTLQSRAQRFAGDQRHHVVQQAVGLAAVEQREDVRMLQARCGADLAQESFATKCHAEVGVQHLDGDITIVFEIVREVHGGHPAGAEFADHAIAVGDGGGETVERKGHDAGM